MADQVGDLEGSTRQGAVITHPGRSTGSATNVSEGNPQEAADKASAGEKTPIRNAAQAGKVLIPAMPGGQSRQLVETLNQILGLFEVEARYFIDPKTNRQVVQLKDKTTDNLIRQVPSEDFLSRVTKTRNFIGLVFDRKV